MGVEAFLALLTVFCILFLLIFTKTNPEIVFAGGLTFLLLVGVLTPQEALQGFSNQGMLTIAVLYIVVAGLKETGGINWIVQSILGTPKSLLSAQIRLMAPVMGMSGFLNNTPVVAMLIPAVREWAKKCDLPVSRLLIPLSYAAILGGTCTLIGTSTNLVVNGLIMAETEFTPLH
ncbi:SLC13 family permease, partial [bacterium]|nr:SLC13 family permease [bacterium]